MKKRLLALVLTAVAACQQPATETHSPIDSMVTGRDSVGPPVTENTVPTDTLPRLDSVPVSKLHGGWTQPVEGIDSLIQGFVLKKNGLASPVNANSPVYEKWQLVRDTLIIWTRSENDSVKTPVADTLVVRAITDTSLVVFPINASKGYTEKYKKAGEKIKKVLKR